MVQIPILLWINKAQSNHDFISLIFSYHARVLFFEHFNNFMELVLESFVNDASWIFAAWLYHIHLALLSLLLCFSSCRLLFLDLQLLTHYIQMLRDVFIPLDVLWFCINLRLECWLFENNRLSTFTGFHLFTLISFQSIFFLLLKLLKDFFRSSGHRRVECTLSFSILLNDNLFEIFVTSFFVMNLVLHKLT